MVKPGHNHELFSGSFRGMFPSSVERPFPRPSQIQNPGMRAGRQRMAASAATAKGEHGERPCTDEHMKGE